jgi:hypothetical protein
MSRAFNTYVRTRQRVKGMVSEKQPALTPREQEMVAKLAHFWDASSETLDELRRHVEPLGGRSAAPDDAANKRLRGDVRDLARSVGPNILVAEPRGLGGFGTRIRGKLLNEDTIRCYRLLGALEDAAVLASFRGPERKTVWEIGGGWGGFAYQFKTLFPNVTYVITALPEQLLVCAVYLQTLFPEATCRFFSGRAREAFWEDWGGVDFAFLPEHALGKVQPPSLELTVDVMALEQMSADRAQAHVRRAFDAGSRYVASLSTPSGAPATDVAALLDRRFWRHPAVGSSYQSKLLVLRDDRDAGRRFYVGWRRLR